jgi:long-subunit fatty acid transport protein
VAAISRRVVGATVAGALVLAAAPAFGQASLQLPLQFDFLNPGARSLALGSAFAGLADDATSGFTNPAGLTILRFPEVSFEGRIRRLQTSFLSGGRLTGAVSNRGIDTVNGPQYGTGVDGSAGPSFMSFVFPADRWAVAAYRHEFVRVAQAFESSGVFQGEGTREQALRGRRELQMNAYGVSAAVRAGGRARFGASVAFYTAKMDASFLRYDSPEFFSAPVFTPATLRGAAEQTADATTMGFSAGGLIALKRAPTGGASGADLQLGVVYRRAGRFGFSGFEGDFFEPVARDGTFEAPDTLAIGMSSHLTPSLTVAVDVSHVGYSSLLDGYISAQTAATGAKRTNFRIADVTEIHAGVEYVFAVVYSPAIRVGAWRDPNHSTVYAAPSNPDLLDQRFAAYLPGAADLTHVTFGAGVAFSPRYEINGAADLSSRTRVFSLSAVMRLTP